MKSKKLINKNYIKKFIITIFFIFFVNSFLIYSVAYKNNVFSNNKLNRNTIVKFYKKIILNNDYKHTEEKNLIFTQEKYYTCGPAAVKYILFYFGITASEKELEEFMNTTEDGTSLYSMKNTIKSYGLKGEGLLVNFNRLSETRMPVIAFVKNDHYIVIKSVTNRYVYVFDPDPKYDNLKLSRDTFLNVWDGVILKVSATELDKEL